MKITVLLDGPYERLEVKTGMDNECLGLVQKRRTNAQDEWNTKVIILNKREQLRIHQIITGTILK